ncbi:hypothetical protein, partial [Streptomyces sp. NRRL F-2664]|uniref:hypothetical protein n=1 Tax=Streptomyces sp. NRRL F-2664 TaxID=1463842 RepID=UPI0005B95CF4
GEVTVYDHPARSATPRVLAGPVKLGLGPDAQYWKRPAFGDNRIQGAWRLDDIGMLGTRVAVGRGAVYLTEPTHTAGAVTGTVVKKYAVSEVPDAKGKHALRLAGQTAFNTGSHIVTTLAVGTVGGEEVLAVGLNMNGVRILRASDLQPSARSALLEDWNFTLPSMPGAPSGDPQDMVTALSFGTREGKPVLAVGRLTRHHYAAYLVDPVTGGILQKFWNRKGWSGWVIPTAFSFGRLDGDRKESLAVSVWSNIGVPGRVGLVPLDRDAEEPVSYGDNNPHPSATPRGLTFFTDAEGRDRLAVGRDRRDSVGQSMVMRRSPADARRMEAVVISAGGDQQQTMNVTARQLERLVPGYQTANLKTANATGRDLLVYLAADRELQKGCWVNAVPKIPGFGFPEASRPLDLPSGKTSTYQTAISTTATAQEPSDINSPAEGCAQRERSAHLAAEVKGQPWTRQIAKAVYDDTSGTFKIASQTGAGELAFDLTPGTPGNAALGTWDLKISAAAEPAPASAPELVPHRLTPQAKGPADPANPNDRNRPVYRIEAKNARWSIPAADRRTATSVPALRVEGAVNPTEDSAWDSLGSLMPASPPSRSADGTVTLGTADFYWQNEASGPAYTHLRVWNGNQSSTVNLGEVPAPPERTAHPV